MHSFEYDSWFLQKCVFDYLFINTWPGAEIFCHCLQWSCILMVWLGIISRRAMPLQYLNHMPDMAGGIVDNDELKVFTSPELLYHHCSCLGDSFCRDTKGTGWTKCGEVDVWSFNPEITLLCLTFSQLLLGSLPWLS